MAAVALSVSVFDAMLKEIYPNMRVESLAKKNRPLLDWMPKADDFEGDTLVVPVWYEDPQGRSADLAKALEQAETTQQTKFVITARRKDYVAVKIEAEAILAARSNVGSFIRAKEPQITGAIRTLGKSLHLAMYREKSGAIGQISSVSTTTVTLTNATDVYNFGRGQTVVVNPTKTGASGSIRATAAKVIGRSVTGKTVTFDTDVAAASWAADDYMYTKGDYDVRLAGLESWLPLTAPDATAFFSVDRTLDVEALSGHRVDNSGRSILQNAEELALLAGEYGGEPDTLFCNPRAGLQLSELCGAKVTRSDGGRVRVGFTGFTLEHFITGPIDVRFDIGCPPDRAYLLQRDTWKFHHLGGCPHIVRDDGRDSLRGATTDDIEVRARYYGEMACEKPGYNGVMSVAT